MRLYCCCLALNSDEKEIDNITDYMKNTNFNEDIIKTENIYCMFNAGLTEENLVKYVKVDDLIYVVIGHQYKSDIKNGELFEYLENNSFKFKNINKKIKGDYIVISYNLKNKKINILSSATCSISCYFLKDPNSDKIVIASELDYFYEYYQSNYLPTEDYIKKYCVSYLNNKDNNISMMTPFRNIFKIKNGMYVSIKNGEISGKFIWNVSECRHIYKYRNEAEIIEKFNTLLEQSITDSIANIKDKEICLHLSGGYDSSMLACMFEELVKKGVLKNEINYLYYDYPGAGSELEYVEAVTSQTGRKLAVAPTDAHNMFLNDFLPIRKCITPTSQVLYGNMKLSDSFYQLHPPMDGQGGDHITASAPESITGILELKNIRLWFSLIRKIMLNKNLTFIDVIIRYLLKPLRYKSKEDKVLNIYYNNHFTDKFKKKYYRKSHFVRIPKYFKDITAQSFFERITSTGILHESERSDLTALQPLLHQEIVEYCMNIPSYYKYDGLNNRIFMINAIKNIIPEKVIKRNSKASTEESFSDCINNNQEVIFDFFQNGKQKNLNILKKGSVLQILKQLQMKCCMHIPSALKILTLDVWLREKGYQLE